MASKFICECGYTICTNTFEGHGIGRLLTDNDVDSVDDSSPAREVIDLWLKSQEVVKCKGCGSLYLWNKETKEYDQYKKVEDE